MDGIQSLNDPSIAQQDPVKTVSVSGKEADTTSMKGNSGLYGLCKLVSKKLTSEHLFTNFNVDFLLWL